MKTLRPFLQVMLPGVPMKQVAVSHVFRAVNLWPDHWWQNRPPISFQVTRLLRKDLRNRARPLFAELLRPQMGVARTHFPSSLLWAIEAAVEKPIIPRLNGAATALKVRPVTPFELAHAGFLLRAKTPKERMARSLLSWWLIGLDAGFMVKWLQVRRVRKGGKAPGRPPSWAEELRDLYIPDIRTEKALFRFMGTAIQPTWAFQYWVVSPEDAAYQRIDVTARGDKAYIRAQMRTGRQFVPKERKMYHTEALFRTIESKERWLEGGTKVAKHYKKAQEVETRREGKG